MTEFFSPNEVSLIVATFKFQIKRRILAECFFFYVLYQAELSPHFLCVPGNSRDLWGELDLNQRHRPFSGFRSNSTFATVFLSLFS